MRETLYQAGTSFSDTAFNLNFYVRDMNHSELLGNTFDCDCGKRHTIPTKHYYYGSDALRHLAEIAASSTSGKTYLLVADTRTYAAAGQRVEALLKTGTADVHVYIVPDEGEESPAADDKTKDRFLADAPAADLYISVGSGVINDLTKWVASLLKKPYLTVPTAASMNGYGSANVAATVEGLKVLFHADACLAAFAEPQVLRDAPFELTTSGLGDVLAKSVSSADWKLNLELFGDYYCQTAVDLLRDLEPVYLNNPLQIRDKDPQALKALFDALFYSSLAMTMTGTSSPASGGEHLISHTLDMLANRDGRKHDLHGRQVGVASILMAALYQEVMAVENPVCRPFPREINRQFWGELSPVVEQEYLKKLPRFSQAAEIFSSPNEWNRLRNTIRPSLIPAEKLKECLRQAGGAHCLEDLRDNHSPLDKRKFIDVVMHANQMRQRFTILDVAVLFGIIPESIEDLIDKWVSR